jgi:hypothetical protein
MSSSTTSGQTGNNESQGSASAGQSGGTGASGRQEQKNGHGGRPTFNSVTNENDLKKYLQDKHGATDKEAEAVMDRKH